jgi:hypothetical protein
VRRENLRINQRFHNANMKTKRHSNRMRELIAQEAARIMSNEMLHDYRLAKQKACERLGYDGRAGLPDNEEIRVALQQYLQLFKSDTQAELLDRLRRTAVEVMEFLQPFQPRLVGPALDGAADSSSPVHLHVFADPIETVLRFLLDKNISYELGNRRFTFGKDRHEDVTVCRFRGGENTMVEMSLFPAIGLREAPRSIVDGKPIVRAAVQEVRALLQPN